MLNLTNPTKTLDFRIDGTKEVYHIPLAKNLPIDYASRLASLRKEPDGAEAIMHLFVEVLNDFAPGAAKRLSGEAAGQLFAAWGDEMGES